MERKNGLWRNIAVENRIHALDLDYLGSFEAEWFIDVSVLVNEEPNEIFSVKLTYNENRG